MKIYTSLVLSVFLAISLLTNSTTAQSALAKTKTSPVAKNAAAKKLRDLYFARDFSVGFEDGQKLIKQFPDDDNVRMWTILNGARATSNDALSVLAMAKEWTEKNHAHIPALIALAMTYSYTSNATDALKTAERAIKLAPDNEEAIFTYNTVLTRTTKYAESIEWLDKNSDKVTDKSRFLTGRAVSHYFAKNKEKSFADFDAAIKTDPKSITTLFLYSDYLNREKRNKEALALLKKAIQLSPYSIGNRVAYWQMLGTQPDKTEEQKEAEIVADMEALGKARPNSPDALSNLAIQYGWMKIEDKQKFYQDQVIKKFPNTRYDEPILASRIIKMSQAAAQSMQGAEYSKKLSEADEAKLLGDKKLLDSTVPYLSFDKEDERKIDTQWRAFIARPKHFELSHVRAGHLNLFFRSFYDLQLPDQKARALFAPLLEFKSDRNSNVNREIAEFLAIRKAFGTSPNLTKDLLSYAHAAVAEAESDGAQFTTVMAPKEAENQKKFLRSRALQTLGFALYLEGDLDGAEKVLKESLELNEKSNLTLLNIALIHRAKKDYDKAEDIYLKIATISQSYETSIRELYRAKNSGLQGFDAYYKTVRDKVREKTKVEIAASRIKEPKDLAPFNLKTIADGSMSSADFTGKVLVINFWGVWCSPCVKEMPELQELIHKYKTDSDVAIITFDFQDQLATVKKFMADKKYAFPVAMADSYLENQLKMTGGLTYPTTFFVDKKGKISFVKTGNTGNLVEEFGMRIDILKQDK